MKRLWREPDAENPPVRFDEGEGKLRSLAHGLSSRASLSTLHIAGLVQSGGKNRWEADSKPRQRGTGTHPVLFGASTLLTFH